MIKQFFLPFISLLLLQISLTHANNSSEKNGISKAKALYAEAVPLAIDDKNRGVLLKQAESILVDIIKQNPQSLDAHRKLMGVYLLQQHYSKAIDVMQNAIRLSPEDPKLFISLAFLYEHSKALDQSQAMLEHALTLDPDNKIAGEYLAKIKKKTGTAKLEDFHQGKAIMEPGHGQMNNQQNSHFMHHSSSETGQ